MASDLNDEAFRKELLDLFALEAQEWIDQSAKALAELTRQPDATTTPKFLDVIQQGMSNLGGSAATVELPEVEQMAYGILPILDTVRSQGVSSAGDQYGEIQRLVEQLRHTIRQLSGLSSPGTTDNQAQAGSSTGPKPVSIEALKEVEQQLTEASQAERNLVALVIKKAGVNDNHATAEISSSDVTRILRELEGIDEQLLADVQRWMPEITEAFSKLKTERGSGSPSNTTLDSLLKSVQELQEAAHRANATNVVQFSRGLHSFLTVMAQHDASLVNGRLQAVEFRLGAVVPMVQQWVETGRIERAAIGKLLSS